MKNLFSTLFMVLVCIPALWSQITWDNFEDSRKGDYGFINGTFIPYTGNPDPTGANTSSTVATYTRNPAEQFDVILLEGQMASLADYRSGTKQMSIDVWSPNIGTVVQITLEDSNTAQPANYPIGRHSVYLATTTVKEAWETLTFTFDNTPDASVGNTDVERIVLLFAPGTNTGDTYYWDNLVGPELANDPCDGVMKDANILNDFECQQNVNFTFSHSGINFRRIPNPDASGANTSSHVARYSRNAGEEFDVIIGNFGGGNLDMSTDNQVHLHVWDPGAPTEVVVSLQYNDGTNPARIVKEMTAMTSTSSSWQDLVYNASDVTDSMINQFVILFDPGNFTGGQYYFDNFRLEGAVGIDDLRADHDFFQISPVPASHSATLRFEGVSRDVREVTLLDAMGHLVATYEINGTATEHTFNTAELARGLYFVRVQEGNRFGTRKVLLVD